MVAPETGTAGVTTIEPIRFEPRADLGGSRPRRWIGPFGLAVALLLLALVAAAGAFLRDGDAVREVRQPR